MSRIPAMPVAVFRQSGVTLVELMVAIAVMAVLLTVAVPTFIDFRERSRVRGAGEQLVAALANARFEAVKRNVPIQVTFQRGGSNAAWCVGAAAVACDCFEKDPSAGDFCAVALYPGLDNTLAASGESQAAGALKSVSMTTNPATAMDGDGSIVINPLTGTLASLTDGGTLFVQSQTNNYQLQFSVNALGRGNLCVPAGSRTVTGYKSC